MKSSRIPLLLPLLLGFLSACPDRKPGADPAIEESGATDWRTLIDEWEDGDPIPDLPLVDHTGRAFQLAELDDDHVLLGFVFSRCPNPKACPLTMQRSRAVQKAWAGVVTEGRSQGKTLRILSVTLDPEFDTPEVLRKYGEVYGAELDNWMLVTGEADLVAKELPSLFNVIALKRGDGDISHGVKVALLGPERMPIQEWLDNEFTAEEVVARILGEAP